MACTLLNCRHRRWQLLIKNTFSAMGYLSALWSSIICYFWRIDFFTHLKQKYLIITFHHVIGSDTANTISSPRLLHVFKDLFPWPCCRLQYLLDFQYNSSSPLHSTVGGTDLPSLGSSFHLSWKVLCLCSDIIHVSHGFLGLICENGFVLLLKLGVHKWLTT